MRPAKESETIVRLRDENMQLRKDMEVARRTTNELNARLFSGEDAQVREEKQSRLIVELRSALREEQARVSRQQKKAEDAEQRVLDVQATLEGAREALTDALEKVDGLLEEIE